MRPRLAKVLASLTGPVTEQAQKSFLQDLKSSFRQRIQHEAAPVSHVVDRHLHQILGHRTPRTARTALEGAVLPANASVNDIARQHFLEGTLTQSTVRALLSAAKTAEDLERIQHWATKAGPATEIQRHPELAAKLATRYITLGCLEAASPLVLRHSKAFIADSAHHALIVQYAAERKSLQEAFTWHAQLETHPKHKRAVLRTLLRASVRQNSLAGALKCLSLDLGCCYGQETGLARWLCDRDEPVQAFAVLKQADPQRAREAGVGLMIAKKLVEGSNEALQLCRHVLNWTEGLYALSLQQELKQVEAKLKERMSDVSYTSTPSSLPISLSTASS
jgi:hypothetical protein